MRGFIAIKQLDKQLSLLKVHGLGLVPKEGWTRTIRKVLGMTIKQLAKRLQVDPSRIVKIETSEISGGITLKTLEAVAEQLGCKLVYHFVPQSSLEEMVKSQAKKIILEQIQRTSHTMDLEDQSVEAEWLEDQIKHSMYELLNQSWKHLWET